MVIWGLRVEKLPFRWSFQGEVTAPKPSSARFAHRWVQVLLANVPGEQVAATCCFKPPFRLFPSHFRKEEK